MADEPKLAWDLLKHRWGWKAEWFGWRRMLWFSVAIDFHLRLAYVVLFGLAISYGRQPIEIDWETVTSTGAGEKGTDDA